MQTAVPADSARALRVASVLRKVSVFMKPTFSIVTPSFRQPEWLKLCAASIADQQGVSLEHIVQDAGTGPELEAWAATQPGLRLCVEKDKGMYDAVNRGLRKSSGEILSYLNCDEQYLPGALAGVAEFFEAHPEVDVLFGDVVVVDEHGEYLCSRPVILPQLHHTQVCTLGVFTAATFFRRRVLEKHGLYFSDAWRDVGDAAWVLEVIRRGLKMAVLRRFTTSFADTGENMNMKPNAVAEQVRLRESAPKWAQTLAPLWVMHFRLRRLLAGIYRPAKLTYAIYTSESGGRRREFSVEKPTFLWRGRFVKRELPVTA
jgi:glycosyltransferase involved in cell wall biosynthesis